MARDQQIIRTSARLGPVSLVPEIRLHQARDPISLWQRTEDASGRTGLDPPFWAFAWAGGQALARYLLDHPRLARGLDVIDIASGSGLVAIAAAMAGAAAVTAYDIDPLAAAAIEVNAAANGVTVRAVCADVLDRDDLPPPGTGLVLVADAFYQRDLAARVMRFAAPRPRPRRRRAGCRFRPRLPAPRPADAAGQLRRARPARDRRQRHQAHHHLVIGRTVHRNRRPGAIRAGPRRVAFVCIVREAYGIWRQPEGRSGMMGGLEPVGEGVSVDTSAPHIARVYDYWLGGKDNFAVDREAAEQVMATFPDVLVSVRAQRAFLGRAVHYLVAEAGIRQFLDIGTGLPSVNNTHEVAQRAASRTRVVYVDNDPIVLLHARALLASNPEGATAYIDADLRDTGIILAQAAEVLDFGQPVAVMLLGVLHCVPDKDDPAAIVTRLMDAVPPGSYLTIAHPASDVATEQMATSMRDYNEHVAVPLTARSHAEVSAFFAGLDLVDPGVVQLHRWRAGPGDPGTGRDLANYGGVGRKP